MIKINKSLFLIFVSFFLGRFVPLQALETQGVKDMIHLVGYLHPVFLHFPIVLIFMVVISECLYYWDGSIFFDHTSRILIISASVAIIPTVITGLAYSYGVHYEGMNIYYFWWHRLFGVLSAILVIAATYLREYNRNDDPQIMRVYYLVLIAVFLCINIAGYFGGILSFGFPEQGS